MGAACRATRICPTAPRCLAGAPIISISGEALSGGSIKQQSNTSERLTSAIMARPASIRYNSAISRSVNDEQELTRLSITVHGRHSTFKRLRCRFRLRESPRDKKCRRTHFLFRRQNARRALIGRVVGPSWSDRFMAALLYCVLVGERGFEPPTSSSRTKRATELRYSPNMYKSITHFQGKYKILLNTMAPGSKTDGEAPPTWPWINRRDTVALAQNHCRKRADVQPSPAEPLRPYARRIQRLPGRRSGQAPHSPGRPRRYVSAGCSSAASSASASCRFAGSSFRAMIRCSVEIARVSPSRAISIAISSRLSW